MLLVKGNEVSTAIEIKLNSAPQLSRGNTEAITDIYPEHRIVISAVSGTFPLNDTWQVYGVEEFFKEMKKLF